MGLIFKGTKTNGKPEAEKKGIEKKELKNKISTNNIEMKGKQEIGNPNYKFKGDKQVRESRQKVWDDNKSGKVIIRREGDYIKKDMKLKDLVHYLMKGDEKYQPLKLAQFLNIIDDWLVSFGEEKSNSGKVIRKPTNFKEFDINEKGKSRISITKFNDENGRVYDGYKIIQRLSK